MKQGSFYALRRRIGQFCTNQFSSAWKKWITTEAEFIVIPTNIDADIDDVYGNECCTTGIGCTANDNCCPYFGTPWCNWKKDTGCCDGMCNYPTVKYPVVRTRCNPWITTVPTNTCIPAGKYAKFSGTSETTKVGLTHSFETCYQYGTNYCWTQSWTDGLGYYYSCLPTPLFSEPIAAIDFPSSCGTPCKDLAPATKTCSDTINCSTYGIKCCTYDSDCCRNLSCTYYGGGSFCS